MNLDVLVIAPHPDDAELGMAGSIMKLIDSDQRVGVLDLTDGEPTPHGSVEIRGKETTAASRVMNLSWRENLGLPNRSLESTIEARSRVAGVIRQTRPRWLFAPYWVDAHPDHIAATQIVEAARFWAKLTKTDLPGLPHYPERIYHYFCVHMKLAVRPDFIVDISPYWERKLEALRCYESQFITAGEQKVPTFLERIRDQAAYWGAMIGTRFAEPFACREPLGLRSLACLV